MKPAAKAKPKAKTAVKVSPLAPKTYQKLPPIKGVEIGTVAAGIKYKNREDLLVIRMPEGTRAAGVFTTSKTASAPVDWCRASIDQGGEGRVVVVNSGNSNAFTGKAGVETVKATAAAAAVAAGCREQDVFIASTGVIGQRLDPAPVTAGVRKALDEAGADRWEAAARAIMTTDTYPKLATRSAVIDGRKVTINGIAKGSGMIAPELATMLVFIVTDAAIPASVLQTLLILGTQDSFNAITVDSDTSTSDTVLLFATGTAKGAAPVRSVDDPASRTSAEARRSHARSRDQVVKDGEGASNSSRDRFRGRDASCRAAHRARLRQLAARQDGDRGRGRKLGTDRHGGGQVGRGGRPRRLSIRIAESMWPGTAWPCRL